MEPHPADGRRGLLDALPWAVLALVVAVDTVSARIIVSGSYPTAAVVASTMSPVRRTSAVAGVSVVLTAASVLWNDYDSATDPTLQVAVSAGLAIVAIVAAGIRVSRESALAHMTVVADTVQRAVLRAVPRQVAEVGFAAEYRSATQTARVGGDLFEVVGTRHGVRVVLGDARGHGIEAVHLAATVLGAFRRAAFEKDDLAAVAIELDRVVAAVAEDEDFVTAVLLQLDPGGRITIVNRGHHPPLLLRPDCRTARFLETGEPQLPLGLGGDTAVVEGSWPPGARMLLYTDGLIEVRDRTGTFFPLERWAPALLTGTLEDALSRLLDAAHRFATHEGTEDIALVLAENRGAVDLDGRRPGTDRSAQPHSSRVSSASQSIAPGAGAS